MATFARPSTTTVKAPYASGNGYYTMPGISSNDNLQIEDVASSMSALLGIAGDQFKISTLEADQGKFAQTIVQRKGA